MSEAAAAAAAGGAPSGEPPAGGAPSGEPPAGGAPSGEPPAGGAPSGEPPAGGDIYRPDGIAETMLGKTNEETIDKLVKTVNGFRQRDQNRPQAGNEVADYIVDETKIDDTVRPFLTNLQEDPVWKTTQAMALKNGMPVEMFQGFIRDVVGEWAQAGILEPPINVAEERNALVPSEAQFLTADEQAKAIDGRMQDNMDWLENAGSKYGINPELAEFAIEALGDRAKGHQFIEAVRSSLERQPSPLMVPGAGAGTKEDLAARESDPRNNPNNPNFNRDYYNETQRLYKELYPSN